MKLHRTLVAATSDELDELITSALNAGWEHRGGVSVAVITAFAAGASEIRKDVQASFTGFDYRLIWAQGMTMENKE